MKRVHHRTMPRVKFYRKSKTVPLQAHQAWNILVSQVMTADGKPSKTKIEYGKLRKQMGYPAAGHTLLHALGTIGELCKANEVSAHVAWAAVREPPHRWRPPPLDSPSCACELRLALVRARIEG